MMMSTRSGNKYLKTTAGAGLLLVALLAAIAVPASECEPLPTVEVSAPASAFTRGLVWRLTSPSGGTSVLMGTMHIGDPRVQPIADAAAEQFGDASVFAMEVVLDANAMLQLQTAMFFPDNENLRTLIGDALFERTVKLMSNYGLPPGLLERMKPWAVFVTLSLPPGVPGLPMDMQLMMQAQSTGMQIRGIETVSEQIGLFESIAVGDQIKILTETICHYELLQQEIEQLIQRYSEQNLTAIYELSLRHVSESRESFMDALLWQRNEKMYARLREDLEDGGYFIAVGALHLIGERGLLELFADAGFTVEPISQADD